MSTLSNLKRPGNKIRLYALYNLFETYRLFTCHYLDNMQTTLGRKMNAFYMSKLIPKIKELVSQLKLSSEAISGQIKLPPDYLPFSNLYRIEKLLKETGRTIEDARGDVYDACGVSKDLIHDAKANNQTSIPEVDEIIYEANRLMDMKELKGPKAKTNLIKVKRPKKFTKLAVVNNYLESDAGKIPAAGGIGVMANLFITGAKILKGNKIFSSGVPQKVIDILAETKYSDGSFRDALFKLKDKFSKNGWPVVIEHDEGRGEYLMIIRYNKS